MTVLWKMASRVLSHPGERAATHGSGTSRRPALLAMLIAVVVTVGVVAAGGAAAGVGRWLVVQDRIDHADAVVILAGQVPIRSTEAATIYRTGAVSEVWIP